MAQQYYDLLTSGGKNTYITVDSDQRFVEAFEKILNIYREGQAYKILVQASAAMHQLLGDLYGLVCNSGGPQETPRARIERTMMMMSNNLSMHVSIHELAAIANMSHAYYTQQFKKHTGESPRGYFNKMKIAKACEYLEKTGNKVETIAHLVGYEDSFYFCRLFKSVTGKTPTMYRQSRLELSTRTEANNSRHE
jgi:AraC-like DNA-binding protein